MQGVSDNPQVANQGIGKSDRMAFEHVIKWLKNKGWSMLASILSKIVGKPLDSREVSALPSPGQSAPHGQPSSVAPGAQPGHPQQFDFPQGGRPIEPQAAPQPAGINAFANLPGKTANLFETICIKPSVTSAASGNSGVGSAAMCDNLIKALAEKLPNLTASSDKPLQREDVESAFQKNELQDFAKGNLGLTGDKFIVRDITSSDVQELKGKVLEESNRNAKFLRLRPSRRALRRGICKAFFGKPDSVSAEEINSVPSRLQKMTLVEARRIWQTIANEMATSCFDKNGNVDVEKLKNLKELLEDAETFRQEPFCLIPHAELVRSQMYAVCNNLILNRNDARDLLNSAKNIVVGQYGQSILKATSDPVLGAAVAILASMFAPNRQSGMPTCTINSTINAETRNHPERLIKMYIQMLSKDQITFPSGHAVKQQEVDNGCITVDLKSGGMGRDRVFKDIRSGNPDTIAEQKRRWSNAGIEYAESSNGGKNYKLRLSVHNMNDVLYAHLLQASNFGNRKIDSDGEYGTMLVYAGHKKLSKIYSPTIKIDGSNFLDGIAKLKEQAKAQQQQGNCYMRVGTWTPNDGHAENIDIAALLALDPKNMKIGNAYPIGDRNWNGRDKSRDIPRLAVRKVNGTPPTFEFGTLKGSEFKKEDISKVGVYTTEISTSKKRRT